MFCQCVLLASSICVRMYSQCLRRREAMRCGAMKNCILQLGFWTRSQKTRPSCDGKNICGWQFHFSPILKPSWENFSRPSCLSSAKMDKTWQDNDEVFVWICIHIYSLARYHQNEHLSKTDEIINDFEMSYQIDAAGAFTYHFNTDCGLAVKQVTPHLLWSWQRLNCFQTWHSHQSQKLGRVLLKRTSVCTFRDM